MIDYESMTPEQLARAADEHHEALRLIDEAARKLPPRQITGTGAVVVPVARGA